jgi:hypothetical protein
MLSLVVARLQQQLQQLQQMGCMLLVKRITASTLTLLLYRLAMGHFSLQLLVMRITANAAAAAVGAVGAATGLLEDISLFSQLLVTCICIHASAAAAAAAMQACWKTSLSSASCW